MKKVKIMLLSLALFAVVGGALAFKAKFADTFCVTNAYGNAVQGFYCSFIQPNGIRTTTTCGGNLIPAIEPDLNAIVLKNCTTTHTPGFHCNRLCPILSSTKLDQ